MTRAFLLGFVVLAAACGGKTFESLCANQVPPPAACSTPCDPAPGATTACPTGYHCGAAGKCDTVCTITGGQCGDHYACTTDGYCVSSDNGGSNNPPDTDACPAAHFTATKTTPSILLLIDRSGSMLQGFDPTKNVDPNTNPEKYGTVQNALVGANGVVTTLQGSVYFGSTLFSDDGDGVCPTLKPVSRAMNNLTPISTSIAMNRPKGDAATPTSKSIAAAVTDFTTTNKPPAGSPPIILLATDGLPNDCGSSTPTPDQTVSAAQAAFKAGIKTYYLFVGALSALKNNQDHPQQMANAGLGLDPKTGTAKYYNATDPTTLSNSLNEIISGVLSCDLQITGQVNADAAQSGTVTLDGNVLNPGTDWTVDQDGKTLHILGSACDKLKNESNPVVDATFSCGAVVIF